MVIKRPTNEQSLQSTATKRLFSFPCQTWHTAGNQRQQQPTGAIVNGDYGQGTAIATLSAFSA